MPFEHQPGEEIGSGWESVVRELGPNWVIKEVNPFDEKGKRRSKERIEGMRSLERVMSYSEEQRRLEEIFGKEHFNRVHFVQARKNARNMEKEPEYLMVQKRVRGEKVSDIDQRDYKSTHEMILDNREEFKHIVWGAKKVFAELGTSMDFHEGNMVREEGTGRVVIVDSGFPSESAKVIYKQKNERSKDALFRAYRRINRIKEFETYLELTEEEKVEMDEEFDLSEESYNEQLERLAEARNRLGITEEEVERFVREGTMEGFLDVVFGEKEEILGNELLDAIMERLGDQEVPEGRQKILDEIKDQANVKGTRDYWKNLIEGRR